MIEKLNKLKYITLLAGIALTLAGCGHSSSTERKIDPKHPVTVTLWNYYNGQTKAAFDDLVREFNDSIGMKKGIIVDSVSFGDISQLAEEVYRSAGGSLGADPMPDLFAAYPENAYRIDELGCLVNLNHYFSAEELASYRQDFLQDCSFGQDGGLKIIPVARSTENLYLNKTDWDKFSASTGASLESLATWEGIAVTAKQYYEWSGGKAFLGIDSFANYILIGAEQLGEGIYQLKDNELEFQLKESYARKLWEELYVPYVNGYYGNIGRFRSDDAKTGMVLAYVGSSAGAEYFPLEVTLDHSDYYSIASAVLPYPRFEDGERCAIVQGAGFAVTKSDEQHEFASVVFLKWLTEKDQNLKFAVRSGYLPVKEDSLKVGAAALGGGADTANGLSVKVTGEMLEDYRLYSNRPFKGSYELRQFFDSYITETVNDVMLELQSEIQKGTAPEEAAARVTDDRHYEEWYHRLIKNTEKIIGGRL